MTLQKRYDEKDMIIPYQELLGNYDCYHCYE